MSGIDRLVSADSPAPVRGGLTAAVLMGVLASLCCLGPLLLVVLGIGGAWVADLTVLDPIRPGLMAATIALLGLAHYRYWSRRRVLACDCQKTRRQATWLWLATGAVVLLLAAPYVLPTLILPSLPRHP